MKIGACTSYKDAHVVSANVDFIEENVQRCLIPLSPDHDFSTEFMGIRKCGRVISKANSFFPGSIKTVGDALELERVRAYAEIAFNRARRCGIDTIVFGSGASRRIPDGTSSDQAFRQFCGVLEAIAPLAGKAEIVVAIEPLNRSECNFINSIQEGAEVVQAVGHPNIKLLADIYHMMREDEPPDPLGTHCRLICHVHVAEAEKRTAPGTLGDDFRAYLRVLREHHYQGDIAIECRWSDIARDTDQGAQELRRQIEDAGFPSS